MRLMVLTGLFFAIAAMAAAQAPVPAPPDAEQAPVSAPPAVVKVPIPAPPDVAKAPPTAKKTASGLAYRVLKAGTGKTHPKKSNNITVHYTGWTTDGTMFDSSIGGPPVTFPLPGLIAGWTEGIQLMVEGEKTRFWIPEALAYKGGPPIRGTLVFDIELLGYGK